MTSRVHLNDNIKEVRDSVSQNRLITVGKIVVSTGISHASARKIGSLVDSPPDGIQHETLMKGNSQIRHTLVVTTSLS